MSYTSFRIETSSNSWLVSISENIAGQSCKSSVECEENLECRESSCQCSESDYWDNSKCSTSSYK